MTESTLPEDVPPPDVVAKLVGSHREFLAFLERRVGRRDLAEDILQEAFVRSMSKASALRDDESAVAWFYRMLRNAIVDRHRRRTTADKALESYAKELDVVTEHEDTKAVACACVNALAATLKPEYADALTSVEIEGLSVKDYAERQGITPSNAAVRVFRAREALRKRVMQSCGTCAEHGCFDCSCGTAACGHSG